MANHIMRNPEITIESAKTRKTAIAQSVSPLTKTVVSSVKNSQTSVSDKLTLRAWKHTYSNRGKNKD